MRPPLEYGDNFPVPPRGVWNPRVPWRFPHHELFAKRKSSKLGRIFPWITLGLGVSLGMLGMSWWLDLPLARRPGQLQKMERQVPQQMEKEHPVEQPVSPLQPPHPMAPRTQPAQATASRLA